MEWRTDLNSAIRLLDGCLWRLYPTDHINGLRTYECVIATDPDFGVYGITGEGDTPAEAIYQAWLAYQERAIL